ncbi:MAG: hypothetical protein LBH28_06225 [Oscillospiraceae bacterium]|nr:hypothetical protein [Oscillospiraceae bacterium]
MDENKIRSAKTRDLSFDKIIKWHLEDRRTAIQFINGVFFEHIPMDAEVVWLDKETVDAEVKMKVADEYIRIGGRLFGIEFEQDDNADNISMKVFDYSLRGARRYGTTSERGTTIMEFPQVCAIFLRSNANTPDGLKWVFMFPDGQSVTLAVPVIKLEDLSVEEIKRRNLMPIGQFKPRTFEPLNKRNIGEFHATVVELVDALKEGVADGSITQDIAVAMHDSILTQIDEALARTDMEVEEIMVTSIKETFPLTDYRELFREIKEESMAEGEAKGMAEGEAKGRAEGEANRDMAIAQAMFKNADNNSPAAIAKLLKAAGISDEIIKEANDRARAERSSQAREKAEPER